MIQIFVHADFSKRGPYKVLIPHSPFQKIVYFILVYFALFKIHFIIYSLQIVLAPFKNFYNQLTDSKYNATTDVYAMMFFCDFINFLILVFGYWAFGPEVVLLYLILTDISANLFRTMLIYFLLDSCIQTVRIIIAFKSSHECVLDFTLDSLNWNQNTERKFFHVHTSRMICYIPILMQ